MKELLMCVVIVSVSAGVHAQVTLVQPGFLSLKPSENLKLFSRVTPSVSGYWFGWLRKAPGKGLEWLGDKHTDGRTEESPALKGRATISFDMPKDEVHLQMTGMQTADSATYYCTRWSGNHSDALHGKYSCEREPIRGSLTQGCVYTAEQASSMCRA
ncbi:hypothetical protein NDU88_003796 [Pleurodeles waltl]|uniref:Immunoglobulin V-set domain-containing protein n=1 Tax=Pleurodeles waltl TaxID=8319 RepID=A0AAV7QDL8_PLEWA|nr:hypothetical protein NDU88_003796 [Pleurodeles waltl]